MLRAAAHDDVKTVDLATRSTGAGAGEKTVGLFGYMGLASWAQAGAVGSCHIQAPRRRSACSALWARSASVGCSVAEPALPV